MARTPVLVVLIAMLAGPPTAIAEPRQAPPFQLPFPCGQVWSGATYRSHSPQNAVDLNRPDDAGDVVLASASGRVSRVENAGTRGYGRWIEIDHGAGWTTRYAHLSRQDVGLGSQLRQGDPIGLVGSTGNSTGTHLHFEQRHNDRAVHITVDGARIHYWGTRDYTSRNRC